MSAFELPRNLVRNVEAHDDSGSARHAWMADLPLIVDELARRWSLDLGRPFQPGGVVSWVAPARNPAGEHLVLKVGWCHDEALHEADGLRVWDGDGAVRLIGDPTGFTQRMADLLGLDVQRLRQWLFARCVQESVDQPHLQSAAIELAP